MEADENHLRDGLEIPFQPRAINHPAGRRRSVPRAFDPARNARKNLCNEHKINNDIGSLGTLDSIWLTFELINSNSALSRFVFKLSVCRKICATSKGTNNYTWNSFFQQEFCAPNVNPSPLQKKLAQHDHYHLFLQQVCRDR